MNTSTKIFYISPSPIDGDRWHRVVTWTREDGTKMASSSGPAWAEGYAEARESETPEALLAAGYEEV